MAILPRRWPTSFLLATTALIALWYLSSLTDRYAPQSLSNAPQPGSPSNLDTPYHWTKTEEQFPLKSFQPLPTGIPRQLPVLQYAFGSETPEEKTIRETRLAAVKESFVHSWNGYKATAWMRDELAPVTGGYVTSFGGWAATLVDTLDTLCIMGLKEELEKAVNAAAGIDFSTTEAEVLNVFETTIRYLGGFLGAYDLSDGKYPVLLEKARELGELLYSAFDTPNHMPVTRWHWKDASTTLQEAGENTLIAEIGSLTLEFTRLSQLTGDPKYYDAIQRITNVFENAQTKTYVPGLWPVLLMGNSLIFKDTTFTLGAMADSLYEYFPKQHMLLGGLSLQYKNMYERAIVALQQNLFFRPMIPDNRDILISGNGRWDDKLQKLNRDPQGQHLGCFAGGMIAIGSKLFNRPDELVVARKLVDGCIWAYDSMVTGIMPETFHMIPCEDSTNCTWDEGKWHDAITLRQRDTESTSKMSQADRLRHFIETRRLVPGYSDIGDRRYILRPEAIESVFILYRLTGDKSLPEAAWRMFTAIEKHTRTEIAHAAIEDVTVENPHKDNRMESFWLAETLKYFYLVFCTPDVVSLDDYVL